MSKIGDHPVFKERRDRKLAADKRLETQNIADLRAALFADVADALSSMGITIKNVDTLVDDLISRGWITKKHLSRRFM